MLQVIGMKYTKSALAFFMAVWLSQKRAKFKNVALTPSLV